MFKWKMKKNILVRSQKKKTKQLRIFYTGLTYLVKSMAGAHGQSWIFPAPVPEIFSFLFLNQRKKTSRTKADIPQEFDIKAKKFSTSKLVKLMYKIKFYLIPIITHVVASYPAFASGQRCLPRVDHSHENVCKATVIFSSDLRLGRVFSRSFYIL